MAFKFISEGVILSKSILSVNVILDTTYIQLTLEQRRFELQGSTYMWVFFFQRYILQYYPISGWLNSWMGKFGYGGQTVKLYLDFQLQGGLMSQCLPCSRVNCTAFIYLTVSLLQTQFFILFIYLLNILFYLFIYLFLTSLLECNCFTMVC